MKLKILFAFAACLLFAACGSDRKSNAPSEFPPATWIFQVDGQAAVAYYITGGLQGNVTKPGSAGGSFSYQKSGNHNGILTMNFPAEGVIEVYQLNFNSANNGTFDLSKTTTGSSTPNQQQFRGNFRKN